MKILLDTNILLWALYNSEELSAQAIDYLENTDNTFVYSIVSLWEVEIKHIKAPAKMPVTARTLDELCQKCGFERLSLKPSHIFGLSVLKLADNAPDHKDPFDKILLCQSIAEKATFLTHDSKLPFYGLSCVKLV